MTRKPNRKPWPTEARWEYSLIKTRVREIRELLLGVQAKGLNGIRDQYLVRRDLPLVLSMAEDIKNACASYTHKKRRGFPLWVGWALTEIKILADAITIEIEAAENAFNAHMRNIYLAREGVSNALQLLPNITKQLNEGPPPEPPQSAIDEIEEIARNAWPDD